MNATRTRNSSVVCPACETSKTHPYSAGESDESRGIDRRFEFFLCENCRLRFQVVEPDEAKLLYADVQEGSPRVAIAGRKEIRSEDGILRSVRKYAPGNRLLEVGSGDGHFLAAARAAGFDCIGIDVSEKLAEVARRRSGAEVLVGDLAGLGLPAESFDIVNIDVVLMYVVAPRDFLKEVARVLRPGGICRIHEYDPDSAVGRIKGKKYWMYSTTHVGVWTRKAIASLSKSAGLPMIRTIHGTEASLKHWLATSRRTGLKARLRDTAIYLLRKCHLFHFALGADTVYYLRKPG